MEQMVKRIKVEFSEGTYKTIWAAIVKTKDKDLLSFWKEHVEKVENPVLHYTIIKEYLFCILDDLRTTDVVFDINQVLKNCRKSGYHKKYYT